MTSYVPAKEFEGQLWVRAADFQKAISEAECSAWQGLTTDPPKRQAEGRSIAAAEQQEPVYHLRQFGDVTKEQLDRYIATGDINPQPEEHRQAEGAAFKEKNT